MSIYDNIRRVFKGSAGPDRKPQTSPPQPSPPKSGRLTVAKTAQSTRYSFGALSPARVARILRSARDGSLDEYFDLLDEVYEKDLRIASELDKRAMDVAGLDYEVIPASDDKQAISIADFVKANLDHIPKFKNTLREIQDAVYKSITFTEIDWKYYGAELWVDELRPWPLAAFRVKDLNDIKIMMEGGTAADSPLPVNKFIVHSVTRGGSIRRAGLGRSLLWYFIFKHYSIKDWISFLEIYGTPLRVGTYEPGTSEDEKRTLLDAVINIATDQGVTMSKQCEIKFIETNRGSSSDAYEKFQQFVNEEISIRINGQVLTTQGASAGGKGSQALGEVHESEKDKIIAFDAESLADTLNPQLIVPLVDFNFGPQDRYPMLRFITEAAPDIKARADFYDAVINKVRLPVSKAHLYDKLNIPAPEEGEDVIEPSASPAGGGQWPGMGFTTETQRTQREIAMSAGTAGENYEKLPEDPKKMEEGAVSAIEAAYDKRRRALIKAAVEGKLPERAEEKNSEIASAVRDVLIAGHLSGRASEEGGKQA